MLLCGPDPRLGEFPYINSTTYQELSLVSLCPLHMEPVSDYTQKLLGLQHRSDILYQGPSQALRGERGFPEPHGLFKIGAKF